jgi:hypothetical protein
MELSSCENALRQRPTERESPQAHIAELEQEIVSGTPPKAQQGRGWLFKHQE